MNETVTKILQQDNHQKWFFIISGAVFSGLAAYLFYVYQGIPTQLETMWFGLCTYIAAGWAKGVDKAEELLKRDLDGDGTIGSSTTTATETPKNEIVSLNTIPQVEEPIPPVTPISTAP